jgi:hypothetical protein
MYSILAYQGMDCRRASIPWLLFVSVLVLGFIRVANAGPQMIVRPMKIVETLSPGESFRTSMTIENSSADHRHSGTTVVGLAKDKQEGKWVVLDQNTSDSENANLERAMSCGDWISLGKKVIHESNVEAPQTTSVDVTIQIPADAGGTYWAAIKVSLVPSGSHMPVRYEYIVPVMLEVKGGDAFLDVAELIHGWQANYGRIHNLRYKLSDTAVASEGSEERQPRPNSREVIRSGECFLVRRSVYPWVGQNKRAEEIDSYDGMVRKTYTSFNRRGKIQARAYSGVSRMGIYLGRAGLLPSLTDKDIERWLSRDSIRVLPKLQFVAGQWCHVIEVGDNGNADAERYWIAQDKGMLLMRYWSPGHHREIQRIASVQTDMGEIWYPKEATRELVSQDGKRRSLDKLTVDYFEPHIKVDQNVFEIEFPIGTRINDEIRGIQYKKETFARDRDWKSEEKLRATKQRVNNRKAESIRKGLYKKQAPSLSVSKWIISPNDPVHIPDRTTILYFWGMYARFPKSKMALINECVRELAKDGISFLSIHRFCEDSAELEKWADEYSIEFPIGVDTKTESTDFWGGKTHRAYGVDGWHNAVMIGSNGRIIPVHNPWIRKLSKVIPLYSHNPAHTMDPPTVVPKKWHAHSLQPNTKTTGAFFLYRPDSMDLRLRAVACRHPSVEVSCFNKMDAGQIVYELRATALAPDWGEESIEEAINFRVEENGKEASYAIPVHLSSRPVFDPLSYVYLGMVPPNKETVKRMYLTPNLPRDHVTLTAISASDEVHVHLPDETVHGDNKIPVELHFTGDKPGSHRGVISLRVRHKQSDRVVDMELKYTAIVK